MGIYEPIDHLVDSNDERLTKIDEEVYAKVDGLKELVEDYEALKNLIPGSDTTKDTRVELYEDRFEIMSERDLLLACLVNRIFKIDEALIEVGL